MNIIIELLCYEQAGSARNAVLFIVHVQLWGMPAYAGMTIPLPFLLQFEFMAVGVNIEGDSSSPMLLPMKGFFRD